MLWAIFLLFRDIQRGEEILYDYGVNVLFEKVIVTFCAIENIWFGIMRLTIWVSKPYIPPQFSFTPMHNLFIWFSLQQPLNDLKLGNVVSNNRPQSKLEFGRFVICHSRVMSLSEFFFSFKNIWKTQPSEGNLEMLLRSSSNLADLPFVVP